MGCLSQHPQSPASGSCCSVYATRQDDVVNSGIRRMQSRDVSTQRTGNVVLLIVDAGNTVSECTGKFRPRAYLVRLCSDLAQGDETSHCTPIRKHREEGEDDIIEVRNAESPVQLPYRRVFRVGSSHFQALSSYKNHRILCSPSNKTKRRWCIWPVRAAFARQSK